MAKKSSTICPSPDCDLEAGHEGWHDDPVISAESIPTDAEIDEEDDGQDGDDDDHGDQPGSNFVNVALTDEDTLAAISALPVLGIGNEEEQAERQAEFDSVYPQHKRIRQINDGVNQEGAPTVSPRLAVSRPTFHKGRNFLSFVPADSEDN